MNWTTPTIDTLAKEGVVLENHYSYELCTPTRGALMTGRYSLRLGLWNENLGELPLSETTLAQVTMRVLRLVSGCHGAPSAHHIASLLLSDWGRS